jgi:dihydroxy-acid dehydratase
MDNKDFLPRWKQATAHSLPNMYQVMMLQNGITGEDLQKPLIGIANSWSEVVPGHRHLRDLAQAVKDGIRTEGGIPLEFNTIAVCDGLASANTGFRYILPSREIVADSVEVMAEAHHFDGIVALSSCDKINPGMLMAAARLHRPFIFVPGGIGCKLTPGHPLTAGLGDSSDTMCPADKLGTAVTGQILSEALGLALPHSSTTYGNDPLHRDLAYQSGKQIVRLIFDGINIDEILTKDAFLNTIRVSLAIGASMNVILHLPAIAAEAGFDLNWAWFDRLSHTTPYISPLAPNGPCAVSTLEQVGGVTSIMKALEEDMATNVLTSTGQTWQERLADFEIDWQLADELGVLRPVDEPIRPDGGLGLLFGSLAPDGAVVRLAGIDPGLEFFEGPARVFDSEIEAWDAIKNGAFEAGEVLIIRYEGLVGGPGMPEESNIAWFLQDHGYRKKVYLLTDARFSGGQAGQCVGMISPEAALGGPIAIVRNGDCIRIDLQNRRIDLLLSEDDITARLTSWKPPEPRCSHGYLARYVEQVSMPAEGGKLSCNNQRGGDMGR